MELKRDLATAALCVAMLASCGRSAEAPRPYNEGVNIIPAPRALELREGAFTLRDGMTIGAATPESRAVASFFAEKMGRATGYGLTVADEGDINLSLGDAPELGEEGYRLDVTPRGVSATAATAQGLFYAMQSFLQLLPAEIESRTAVEGTTWSARAVSVEDAPRFAYRGLMVDPCRHWMTVDEIKRQIDVMAMLKINRLHWHLTEDQGWRVEIKKYPKLTEVGGKRIEGEGTEYGPFFYTQDEVRDVVKYAADRFITVVPELEIPGHELAAIAAYPELSCTGEETTPRVIWGVEDIVMCPGREETFEFLQDVIDEMAPLFPGSYFHIGGDECPKDRWKKCPRCQKRIRDLGIKGDARHSAEELLQTYVVERVEKYLAGYGKRIIGWDEILEGKPAPTATVMSWRGEAGGIAAALAGHDAIMTPSTNGLYLDHYQGDSKTEPVAIGGFSTLEKVYSYDPVPDTLAKMGLGGRIAGVQANVWSEYLYTNSQREYMTYPRALALAEVGWTPAGRKDFGDFARRVGNACVRLDGIGVEYHIPLPEQPGGSLDHVVFTDRATLEFKTSRPMTMVYTTDGTEPTPQSAVYTEPLEFSESGTLRIATLLPSGRMSRARIISVEKRGLAAAVAPEGLRPGLSMQVTDGMYLNVKELDDAKREPSATKVISALRELTQFVPPAPHMRGMKQYAAVAEGYVDIPDSGVYVVSSDLEEVWIDGELVVDNSGEVKRFSRNDSSIALEGGKHALRVVFLGHIIGGWPSNWGDGSVRLRKMGGADGFKPITPEMLWH